jgi:hypothetical protein
MKSNTAVRILEIAAVALTLVMTSAPANAQWVQVPQVPTRELFSLSAKGDTIAAGADTAVFLSTDGGASWRSSSRPAAGVVSIQAAFVRNARLYAGTFGQGVFISDDFGQTWQAFNQGLVGGFLDSQLDITDLVVRGDSIYAATAGAGVYVRGLVAAGMWQPFGDIFEPNQAPNINSLALGGTRLLALAGANGAVFRRDPGEPEWTISNLDNVGVHAALTAQTGIWTGSGWVVGSNLGLFLSTSGQEPWTRVDIGIGVLDWTTFAVQSGHLFAAFDTPAAAVMEESSNNGANWGNAESLPNVFVKSLAISNNTLYAARGDGLWRHPTGTAAVPIEPTRRALGFALVGPQPFNASARLRFELPAAGNASIEVFDIAGRAAGERIEGAWSAGAHEISIDAGRLPPGVYAARLSAGGRSEVVRLVHIR